MNLNLKLRGSHLGDTLNPALKVDKLFKTMNLTLWYIPQGKSVRGSSRSDLYPPELNLLRCVAFD